MESCLDPLNWLESDMCLKIFSCLENPSDLVCAYLVSRSWRYFVIENGLLRQLSLRRFPQLSRLDCVMVENGYQKGNTEAGSSRSMEFKALEREHQIFASFAHISTPTAVTNCISDAVSDPSTDSYPADSIHNTLRYRIRIGRRASYGSRKEKSDPTVPESLIYRLRSSLCVITEINIRPFQAYFQLGYPISSAKSVRFRMGHAKSQSNVIRRAFMEKRCPEPAEEKFVWTYTSKAFPIDHENRLQIFKLPEPVLCIGGFLQIELMGRVQRQYIDSSFYLCVAHVQAVGRSLLPAFNVNILEPSGKFSLKYFPEAQLRPHRQNSHEDSFNGDSSSYLQRRERDLDHVLQHVMRKCECPLSTR